jgi:hypothetical protein
MNKYNSFDDVIKDIDGKQLEVKSSSWLNILFARMFGRKFVSENKKTVFCFYRNELYLLKIDFIKGE